MTKPRYLWLVPVFLQHAAVGSVTSLIIAERWVDVFMAAYLMQTLWWINMGQRIDRHGRTLDAIAYCTISAMGLTLGAWIWR